MSSVLPGLRGTSAQSLYPFDRTVYFNTTVCVNADGSEQRFANAPPLNRLSLPMTLLEPTDKAAWLAFFNSTKGQFTSDLVDTIGGVAFGNMTLDSDTLLQVNTRALLYDQRVTMRQVQNASWTPATAPTAFPTLSFGTVAEVPYTQGTEFLTGSSQNVLGPQYQFAYYANAVAGFPTAPLKTFKITYGLIEDADAATLETFFLAAQGQYYSFNFTDPISGITYSHVRFDQDALTIRYLTVNQKSTEILLRQTFNS